jgi:hypothetical protein
MLDGICASINCGLYARSVSCMDGNSKVLAVCFFNHRREFGNREILIRRDLDHIDLLELIPTNRLSRPVRTVDQ